MPRFAACLTIDCPPCRDVGTTPRVLASNCDWPVANAACPSGAQGVLAGRTVLVNETVIRQRRQHAVHVAFVFAKATGQLRDTQWRFPDNQGLKHVQTGTQSVIHVPSTHVGQIGQPGHLYIAVAQHLKQYGDGVTADGRGRIKAFFHIA